MCMVANPATGGHRVKSGMNVMFLRTFSLSRVAWRRSAQAGFSLIELSIVLVVISILSAGMFRFVGGYVAGASAERTDKNLERAHKGISLYLDTYGHLPCPAPLDAVPGERAHGFALDCGKIAAMPDMTAPSTQYRIAEGAGGETVIIGRLPSRTLNLSDAVAKDGWGYDLQYAVTLRLTNIDSYRQADGAITVVDEHDIPMTEPEGNVQYVIISAGDDHVMPGTPECSASRLDGENCDFDAVFRTAQRAEGTKHFDDIIGYKSWVEPAVTADTRCDMVEYLGAAYKISENMIHDATNGDLGMVYLQGGESLLVCNKDILKQMGEKDCTAFMCDKSGAIKKWKVM